jgi:hypothetical protein
MSYKLRPKLGSAIASTVLSVFWAVSLVGVDKAQAAVLTYNFLWDSNFLKVDNSSLTGIGVEEIAVSEGRFYGFTASFDSYPLKGKDYYDLAGATALFYQGEFVGLNASGYDTAIREINFPADESHGPSYVKYVGWADWSIRSRIISGLGGYGPLSLLRLSFLSGYKEVIINDTHIDRSFVPTNYSTPVSYTLVDTEPSPVPEPLTAGGTALALAGLSWLKHKKKKAA